MFRGTVEETRKNCVVLSRYLLRNLRKADVQIAMFRRNVRGARFLAYALLAWTARLVNLAKDSSPSSSRHASHPLPGAELVSITWLVSGNMMTLQTPGLSVSFFAMSPSGLHKKPHGSAGRGMVGSAIQAIPN